MRITVRLEIKSLNSNDHLQIQTIFETVYYHLILPHEHTAH